jgi:putative spermidine/putrescine transport system substrate-binding protein
MTTNRPLAVPAVARRALLGSAATLTLGIGAAGRGAAQSRRIVSTIFGGKFEEEYRKAIVEPFRRLTGVEVQLKYGNGAEWLTSAVINRNNPEIDLLWLAYPENVQAIAEDLCIELTPQDIPNLANVYPEWYEGFRRKGVGLDYASFGIGWRTDLVRTAPASWQDLWRPEYRGRLALPDLTTSGGYQLLVMAAIINGGSEDNVEPGFQALRRLRPNVRKFYRSNPEMTQMLERGEAHVCAYWDGRVWALTDAGVQARWVAPREGALVGMVSYHVPHGTRDKETCKRFIDFAISKEAQEAFCNGMQYGPVNRLARLSGPAAERVPPLESLRTIDWFKIVPSMGAWLDRWNREVIG